MDQEPRKSGWKIWLYLTPVYIIVAIPLVRWTIKVNSGDVDLSKDEYKAFNSQEGEIKKSSAVVYSPDLDESGYSVRYRSGHSAGAQKYDSERKETAGAKRQDSAGAQGSAAGTAERKNTAGYQQQPLTPMQQREQKSFGFTKGYLTYAVGKTMNNPKAVSALFNNSFVVGGFMARDTVKAALGSAQGLQNYLSNTSAVNTFLGNNVVKAALANPQIINAVASSSLASAIISSPAIQDLIKNPDSINNILASNPQIAMFMADPNIMRALMNNPQTAGVVGGLNLGGGNIPKR